jgi:iron complex transport system substrate-binding protein
VTPEQVCLANPEIIFASWCGKPVDHAAFASRHSWREIAAVRTKQIHEIPSQHILQPGFGLMQGYETLKRVIREFSATN